MNPFVENQAEDQAVATANDDDPETERACESLIMCIVTTLNHGLRNGGGIGDVLRSPSTTVSFVKVVLEDLHSD